MEEGNVRKDKGEEVKMRLDDIKMKDLTSSYAVENMYVLLAALFIISFTAVTFIGHGKLINAVVGTSAIFVAIVSFLYTFTLYGIKSKEGWVWMILSISGVFVFASSVTISFGLYFLYFLFRFLSIPIMASGIFIKLWFAGLDLDLSQKTVSSLTILGWILLAFVSSILPAMKGGFDYQTDSYAFFAFAEIFTFMMALLVIQTIKGRGWFIVAVGMLLISMGDIFHPLANEYALMYPGSPVKLLWYLGLLVSGFGAYYQRKEDLKKIAL